MKITRYIDQVVKDRRELSFVERMVRGDHWLDGAGWIGPRLQEGSQGSMEALEEIERSFVAKNVLGEIVTRHRDAVVGAEPTIRTASRTALERVTVGADSEEQQEDENLLRLDNMLTEWIDGAHLQREIQQAVKTLQYAKLTDEDGLAVSPIRMLIVPPDAEISDGDDVEQVAAELEVEVATRTDAAGMILFKHHSPRHCGIYRDEYDRDVFGFYYYRDEDIIEDGKETDRYELTMLGRTLNRKFPQLASATAEKHAYGDDETVILIMDKLGSVLSATSYDLGGMLTIYEMRRESLVNETLVAQQKLWNLSLTMMGHNVILGGFLERTILNGQRPGKWVNAKGETVDPDTAEEATFMPDNFKAGAGALNFIMGEPIYDDETGEIKGYTTPQIIYRDPVSVDTFKETIAEVRQAMYEEAKQAHVVQAQSSQQSGDAIIQSTNDFVASLGVSAKAVEAMLRWAALLYLKMMRVLIPSEVPDLSDVRITADVKLSAVQPTSEALRVAIELYNNNLVSQETAMGLVGVDDVEAEKAKILEERGEALELNPRLDINGDRVPDDDDEEDVLEDPDAPEPSEDEEVLEEVQ